MDTPDVGDVNEASARADEGESLRGQHRYADAETAYRAAIRLDPALAAAHGNLNSLFVVRRWFSWRWLVPRKRGPAPEEDE